MCASAKSRETCLYDTNEHAIVLVNKATAEVQVWCRTNLHLNGGRRSYARRDDGARASGRAASFPNSRLLSVAR